MFRHDWITLGCAVLTVTLWASAFAGIRVASGDFSPTSIALLRYLVASLVLLVYAVITQMPLPSLRDLPGIAALGFLGFSAYNDLLVAGQVGVSAGIASFIISTEIILTALLAARLANDRLTRWGWAGVLISLAGVGIISAARETGLRLDVGVLLIVAAAVVKAGYSVGQKRYLTMYGALRFATYAIWCGTLFLLVFTPGLVRDLQSASLNSVLAVVHLGVFPGAIGYIAWSFVLSRMPTSVAATFLYFAPFLATLIAWVWVGEVPRAFVFVGGALVVAGVVVVSRKGKRA